MFLAYGLAVGEKCGKETTGKLAVFVSTTKTTSLEEFIEPTLEIEVKRTMLTGIASQLI